MLILIPIIIILVVFGGINMKIKSRYENTKSGYIKLYFENGKVVEEHRYLMEHHLGRKLFYNEIVHHKDGNKKNNNLDNLEIKPRDVHARRHQKPAELAKLVCSYCGNIFEKEKRYIKSKMKNGQTDFYCNRHCMALHFGRGRNKYGCTGTVSKTAVT